MHNKVWIFLLLTMAVAGAAFAGGNKEPDVSYAFGVALGSDLKDTGFKFDYNHFLEGFKASMEGKSLKLSVDEAMTLIQAAFLEIQEAQAAENRLKGEAFLADNAKRPEVKTTESGLQYEVLREGDGIRPVASDTVRVHYEGSLIDGTVFDSSLEWGEPVEFPLDGVIPGWTEGIQLMSVGSKYKLYIPSDLGYGEYEAGEIPPASALIFDVELLEIVK
jgi:FKBP-type peptidyl-prolyl cis-trans isomerase